MKYTVLKWGTYLLFRTVVTWFCTPRIVTGTENLQDDRLAGPIIIAANHDGRIDPVWIFVMMYRHSLQKPTIRFLSWYTFYDMPILGWYIKGMKSFRIESGKGLEILDPVVDYLKEDGVVGIFPEGKIRKVTEKDKRAKRGVGYLSIQSQSPVLPIYVKYHKKKILPGYWLEIHFGEIWSPVTEEMTLDSVQAVADEVLEKIYQLKPAETR